MTRSIPDDVIWPTSTITPDEFGTIARVLSAEVFPCWRFVINTSRLQGLVRGAGGVVGYMVDGVLVPDDRSVPFIPRGTPYVAADAFVIHELLKVWYAGPRDAGKLHVIFEKGYGVKLRRGEKWLDPFRAQLIYPRDESQRFGKTCAAAFPLGWRWDKETRNTLFRAGTSAEDVSRLATLVELTATEVFNAHRITEVWVAPYDRYRS